jgi:Zn-dependent peptidase ImmA (M78 family)
MMRLSEFFTHPIENTDSESINVDDFKEILKKFLPLAKKVVKLDKMPKIVLKKTITHGDQPTMGRFYSDLYTLELAIANRQPVDILRTLAHELVHAKQARDGVVIDPSTGSEEENEANAVAGIVMRHFNKKYPEYLSFQPVTESTKNGRTRIC